MKKRVSLFAVLTLEELFTFLSNLWKNYSSGLRSSDEIITRVRDSAEWTRHVFCLRLCRFIVALLGSEAAP